ncbi:unnamed protein product [Spirodela intermedia]|uniref:Uncharacterized protein n=1 Tax=Spirodela intermedia TaxID=51605 RepID=A0A7I8IJ08_SPIIN|nr:unnamed protein product [Spirodela intermedia]CAA6657798.1 unnamed protein product [Spirodela intermedia]
MTSYFWESVRQYSEPKLYKPCHGRSFHLQRPSMEASPSSAAAESSPHTLFSEQSHRVPEDTLRILDTILPPFLQDYIWQHENFNLFQYSPSAGQAGHLHGRVRYGTTWRMSGSWCSCCMRSLVGFRRFPAYRGGVLAPSLDQPREQRKSCLHPRWQAPYFAEETLPFESHPGEALEALESGRIQTSAPDSVQEAVGRRLSGYPERARRNMHRVRVRVPLPVAQVLRREPCLISLAVEGFYDRDIDSMKHASKMARFLTSVVMSRAMYAQLVRQSFNAPKCYPIPSREQGPVLYGEAELGMKIACGFEMMYQYRRLSGDEKALESHGYFEGLLPGSMEYRRRMDEALERHKNSVVFSHTRDVLSVPVKRIEEILSLPHSVRDFVGSELPPSDDDSWLYDGEEELNSAILERQREMENYELKRRGKEKPEGSKNSEDIGVVDDFSLGEMAKTMQAFVEKISSFEGAEVPGNGGSRRSAVFKDMESVLGGSGLQEMPEGDGDDIDKDGDSSSDFDFGTSRLLQLKCSRGFPFFFFFNGSRVHAGK